ncbi:MAG TPA: hypothetical protein VMZ04_10130, partial [Anaerolineae bacterium]|nr:hypothetical protein [Anaerolineae bacterium]
MRTTRRSFTILYLCVTIMCAAAVHGQNEKTMVAQDKDESQLTYSAGSTITRNNPDGSWTKILSRGVNAHHQDTDLTAEEGLYNGSVSEIRFYGNAVFKDSVRKLNADTLIYLENSREAFAIGHVIVSESGRSLWADRVRYQKDIRRIEASGNVTVMDDSTRSFINGMEAVFNDSTGHGLIIG